MSCLATIGCVDANGNNAKETLVLTGLTVNTLYYFRIFGATNNLANRTGTYTFCGTTDVGGIVLPVEIGKFNASVQNNNVLINWTTVSESNNAYFEIQRSLDGKQFKTIGKLAGKGTSSLANQYSFTDNAALSTIQYYRLKQVNFDGAYKYSTILTVQMNNDLKKRISISPNPVTDHINLRIHSDATTSASIRIINTTGQTIMQQTERVIGGENIISIKSLQNLSKGMYTIQVIMDSQSLTSKFIYTQ